METVQIIVALLIGIGFGFGACWWLFLNTKVEQAEADARSEASADIAGLTANLRNRDETILALKTEVSEKKDELKKLQTNLSTHQANEAKLMTIIREERKQATEKLELLNNAQQELSDAFKALSSEALRDNNESFLKLATSRLEKYQETAKNDLEKRQLAIDALVKPVERSLKSVDEKLQELEKNRVEAYSALREQVQGMTDTQTQLRKETANLVNALRKPSVRGRWGEIQLRRVVEMAGMLDHCDFFEQQSVNSEDGQLRPDLLVQLPGRKNIVVDSKVPLTAFLEAIESEDEETRLSKLKNHAKLVKDHILNLSKKSYFAQFHHAPEFVVLFLPGEIFFSAALEHDPTLIEMGVEQNVIIATPTTLISLLKAVAYGWTQERLAENAREISQLGKELYTRLSQMGDHMAKVGKGLENATKAYNSAVGSLESRVFVTARKFNDLHLTVAGKELSEISLVENSPRALQAPEVLSENLPAAEQTE